MANLIKIGDTQLLQKLLKKLFQSGHLNFLFGSGASYPAIQVSGNIENEIQKKFSDGLDQEAQEIIYGLLLGLQRSSNILIDNSFDLVEEISESTKKENQLRKSSLEVLGHYRSFIKIVEKVLNERKNNIHTKKANMFTTNYDIFLEKACDSATTLLLNDGFNRTPNPSQMHIYSSKNFFNSIFNTGNLYNYRVELPSLNLIKIHGSLTWNRADENVIFRCDRKEVYPVLTEPGQIETFNKEFALIVPQKGKFRETLMDRTYYDLLRIYANELDKEGCLLVVFGFSFEDEHIRDITVRALKNPTLYILIFAHSVSDVAALKLKFEKFNNVTIVEANEGEKIYFKDFNGSLSQIVPSDDEGSSEF